MRFGLLLLSPLLAALVSLALPTAGPAGEPIPRKAVQLGDNSTPGRLAAGNLVAAVGQMLAGHSPDTPTPTDEAPASGSTPSPNPSPSRLPVETAEPAGSNPPTLPTTEAPATEAPLDEERLPDRDAGLPITGAQVGGMVLLGTGLLAGGFAMLAVHRRRYPADLLDRL